MKKIAVILILVAVLIPFTLSGCVTTGKNTNKKISIADYPEKDRNKAIQANKVVEWEKLDKIYGPAEVEIFYVHDTKIKRYTYQGIGVIYRVLFYDDKIESIVTDR